LWNTDNTGGTYHFVANQLLSQIWLHSKMVTVNFFSVSKHHALKDCGRSERMFKALYGVNSQTMADAWEYLTVMETIPYNGQPMHLLWLCYWWKGYQVSDACAKNLGTNHVTFKTWVEKFERAVAELPVVREHSVER